MLGMFPNSNSLIWCNTNERDLIYIGSELVK